MSSTQNTQQKDGKKKPVVDRDTCIGAGPCIAVAPEYFQLDDEGKAVVLDAGKYDEEKVNEAINACPVAAIKWNDEQ